MVGNNSGAETETGVYDAFNGVFQVHDSDDGVIKLSWENHKKKCQLAVNLINYKSLIQYTDDDGNLVEYLP